MTNSGLKLAGFLAMVSAALSVPFLILSYQLAERDDLFADTAQATMHIAGLLLFIFLAVFFKRLLNRRHSFHDVDNYIDFLITLNLIMVIAGIAGLYLPAWEEPITQFSVLLIIAFGLAHVLFGFKLFRLPDPLKGMLKPYCFCTITTGILICSIVLIPIGIITGAVADVMLGTIFFQAVEKHGANAVE